MKKTRTKPPQEHSCQHLLGGLLSLTSAFLTQVLQLEGDEELSGLHGGEGDSLVAQYKRLF